MIAFVPGDTNAMYAPVMCPKQDPNAMKVDTYSHPLLQVELHRLIQLGAGDEEKKMPAVLNKSVGVAGGSSSAKAGQDKNEDTSDLFVLDYRGKSSTKVAGLGQKVPATVAAKQIKPPQSAAMQVSQEEEELLPQPEAEVFGEDWPNPNDLMDIDNQPSLSKSSRVHQEEYQQEPSACNFLQSWPRSSRTLILLLLQLLLLLLQLIEAEDMDVDTDNSPSMSSAAITSVAVKRSSSATGTASKRALAPSTKKLKECHCSTEDKQGDQDAGQKASPQEESSSPSLHCSSLCTSCSRCCSPSLHCNSHCCSPSHGN